MQWCIFRKDTAAKVLFIFDKRKTKKLSQCVQLGEVLESFSIQGALLLSK